MRFEDFARIHGLVLDIAYPSDKIRRCGTEAHARSDNGAYFYDGRRGWVRVWDGDGETHWWNDPDAKPWTEQEKKAWAAKRAAEQRRIADGWRRAAEKAQSILSVCAPGPHMYLRTKGLADVQALVTPEDDLFVPMRAFDTDRLVGGQVIRWAERSTDADGEIIPAHWEKKMLYGMRARGAVLRLGSRHAPETWFCEGYATGLSIELALMRLAVPAQVIVCFSDHNMVDVAQQVSGRRFTFADHDKSGAGQRAAERIGVPVAMSARLGEDANDLHQREGLFGLCRVLMEARRT